LSCHEILTVCQPWAWAILHAGKSVENRTRATSHRGPLLIHAGKSRRYLKTGYRGVWPAPKGVAFLPAAQYVLGAVVGVVDLMDCMPIDDVKGNPWSHGPFCWLVANPRPLKEPSPLSGHLGLFDVDPVEHPGLILP